jgi:DNA-binding response OmpR family regulator
MEAKMPNSVILAIDDEEDILNLISLVLSRDGYKVIVAKGGAEGLHTATLEHPDLVLLDIMMPDIDGYEVLNQLRERKIRTRVIFLTAKVAYTRDLITLARSGVCDYITKPFRPEELKNSVRRALEIENPFDLRSDELAPIVNELLSDAKRLENDNQNLKEEAQELRTRSMWWVIIQRLIYLLASISVSLILHGFGVLNSTQSAVIFILLVFVLLLLPIERIRNLYAKTPKIEVGMDVSTHDKKRA